MQLRHVACHLKENIMQKAQYVSSRPVPYTTKSGVQIGLAYQPKPQSLTQDGEFIQSVLLGDKSSLHPHRGIAAYAVVLFCVFLALAAVMS